VRISWLPRYGPEAASTRIRVHTVHAALDGLCESVIGYDDSADVLIVQKAVDHGVFDQAASFNGRVVYDFDDVMDQAVLRRAEEVAEFFTTDTVGRKSAVRGRCEVVPDSIDYAPAAPWPPGVGQGAVWFGNYPNFESARWMVTSLTASGVPVRAIADLTAERAGLPIEIVPWTYDTFVAELRKSGVAILSHGDSDPFKSNNKMCAAITLGVPCIVNGSSAYSALADSCGLSWSVASGPEELLGAYERLADPAERHDYLAASQPLVWETWNARAVARRLLEVLEV